MAGAASIRAFCKNLLGEENTEESINTATLIRAPRYNWQRHSQPLPSQPVKQHRRWLQVWQRLELTDLYYFPLWEAEVHDLLQSHFEQLSLIFLAYCRSVLGSDSAEDATEMEMAEFKDFVDECELETKFINFDLMTNMFIKANAANSAQVRDAHHESRRTAATKMDGRTTEEVARTKGSSDGTEAEKDAELRERAIDLRSSNHRAHYHRRHHRRAQSGMLLAPLLLHGLLLPARRCAPPICAASAEVDEGWMHYALKLAERGRFSTAPNPWVGCVIVADGGDGEVLAEGYHQRKGGPHAEAAALADARAKGVSREQMEQARCYVTLEPCHMGPGKTTPACDEALVAAGLRDVHVALVDPDPTFGLVGVDHLRGHGVSVTVGTGSEAVSESLRPYLHQRLAKKPYVVLKVATALDGTIGCEDGTSQWITGDKARSHAQLLRAGSQARSS